MRLFSSTVSTLLVQLFFCDFIICIATTKYDVFQPLSPTSPVGVEGFPSLKSPHQPRAQHSGNSTTNSTIVTTNPVNMTIARAEAIVRAAQAANRVQNAQLIKSPRRNKHEFRDFHKNPISAPNRVGKTPAGLDQTVADAAAFLATAVSQNSTATAPLSRRQSGATWWMESMTQNGLSPYAPSGYKVWRNVKDYGAVGDGVHDDTAAINAAITAGNRCGASCSSTTTLQAVVYFPHGRYLVSSTLIQYYFTQFIGDPNNLPVIVVASSFVTPAGVLGVISSDIYTGGPNSQEWYINQSNFYRQIRNLVIDMTGGPANIGLSGIHWQVAQATSIQNVQVLMTTASGNTQMGIFMENGSGGFLTDLIFTGGAIGMYVGNQQFTVRNIKFSHHAQYAIQIIWDWGWTWKGINIDNCLVGIYMHSALPDSGTINGSAIFIDSTITNTLVGIDIETPTPTSEMSLSLFSMSITNVGTIVHYYAGATLLAGTGGSLEIAAWGMGKRYDTNEGEVGVYQSGPYPKAPEIVGSLLKNAADQQSGYFERSKPQYKTTPAANFINVKLAPYNAIGNGVADDTQALRAAFLAVAGMANVLFIPAGIYLVSNTILIPSGAKVVGQSWAQIMAYGSVFDQTTPVPVIKVGNVGDIGSVEISDLIFTTRGPLKGATIIEWNIHESSQGAAAMWDTHIRIGGAVGTNLRVSNCPKLTGTVNNNCIGASTLVHVTSKASAYFENNWFWVADHDIDDSASTQIDVYVARGVLVESAGPVLFYGTASEHSVLYQYQLANASNIFLGMIQTESPYFQVAPPAPAPFAALSLPSDPSFGDCSPTSTSCAMAWAVQILNSYSIYIYGAGLYSWFQNYDQTCVNNQNCQDRIFEIQSSSDIWIYNLITKASVEMISPDGGLSVLGADNHFNYCDIILAWLGSAGYGTDDEGDGGVQYRSPISATVIPFPATMVNPTQTFTVGGPVVSSINTTPNDGNQNTPVGPGADLCVQCDLARLITSTCCGTGGGVSNPITISPGTAIPRPLILPAGFIPNQQVIGDDGTVYPVNAPLPYEVVVPAGTSFAWPFIIPQGLGLSDIYTPGGSESESALNGTLYIITTFWTGPHTISCTYPCTLLLPPITSTTTITPAPVTVSSDGTTSTITPPVLTSELIRISKTVVTSSHGSSPTKVFIPLPALKPLCIKIPLPFGLGTITIGLCPPDLSPFPPTIPIPPVTIIPLPPGGKPGPTQPSNKPSPEQEEEEDEDDDDDDEEDETCSYIDGDGFETDEDVEDELDDSDPFDWTLFTPAPIAAGTGFPTTTTMTVTFSALPLPAPTTAVATQAPTGGVTPPSSPSPGGNPGTPSNSLERYVCNIIRNQIDPNAPEFFGFIEDFCITHDGDELLSLPGGPVGVARGTYRLYDTTGPNRGKDLYIWVSPINGCSWTFYYSDCIRILTKLQYCAGGAGPQPQLNYGGLMESNCAMWTWNPEYDYQSMGQPIENLE